MGTKKINCWIVVGILTLSSIWVMSLHHRDKDITQGIIKMIEVPYEINDWQGKDIELGDEILEILGTDKVMMREYRNPEDEIIWLYLIYSEKDRTSFHPPEYCYTGGGNAELLEKDLVTIPIDNEDMSVNRLVFQTRGGMQMVIFWFTADKKMFASYYKQQLHIILNTLRGNDHQGTMVRLSTFFKTQDREKNFQILKEFINDLIPYLSH